MTSLVDIANIGLIEIGEEPISDLQDAEDESALALDAVFPRIRDAVLRAHVWNSAKARKNVAADAAAPDFGYARQFTWPTDPYCLRPLRHYDREVEFVVEGRKILSDAASPFKLIFIARITDPNLYDAMLVDTLGSRLAAAVCYRRTNSRSGAKAAWDLYRDKLRDAKSVDGMEGTPEDFFPDSFLDARSGS